MSDLDLDELVARMVRTPPRDHPHDLEAGDVATARRFVDAHGHRFRYFAEARRWLVYDRGVWSPDPDRIEARAAAEQVARGMLRAAADEPDPDRAKRLAQDARRTMTSRRLDAMLDVAEPHLAVRADALDADPWLLNVANGVVDLRTGQLLPHDPTLLLTRQTAAAFDPDATGTTWRTFLDHVQPDPQVRAFLARLSGVALVGHQREHLLPIAHGTGANGKSTFYSTLGQALGTYAGKVDVSVLVGRGSDRTSATPELMALRGLRLVVADEPEAGARLREAQIKALSGGDQIIARPLYGDPVAFDPSHLLTLVSNHRPEVAGTDDGIWRRLLLIPWQVSIPKHEQDPDLPAKLAAEVDAVLAWAVAGCLDWQRRRLDPPQQVQAATDDYRAEQDHLAAFIDDECIVSTSVRTPTGKLREAYDDWCRRSGLQPKAPPDFWSELTDRGFPAVKSNSVRARKGIALKAVL
jgi:putative DNA primase/helicase